MPHQLAHAGQRPTPNRQGGCPHAASSAGRHFRHRFRREPDLIPLTCSRTRASRTPGALSRGSRPMMDKTRRAFRAEKPPRANWLSSLLPSRQGHRGLSGPAVHKKAAVGLARVLPLPRPGPRRARPRSDAQRRAVGIWAWRFDLLAGRLPRAVAALERMRRPAFVTERCPRSGHTGGTSDREMAGNDENRSRIPACQGLGGADESAGTFAITHSVRRITQRTWRRPAS
jgi:hypothetical protein